MNAVAAANEYKSNIGSDYCLEAELAAEQEVEDLMSTEQRQALNASMAEWYGIG